MTISKHSIFITVPGWSSASPRTRKLAHNVIRRRYNIDPDERVCVQTVSVDPTNRTVTYRWMI